MILYKFLKILASPSPLDVKHFTYYCGKKNIATPPPPPMPFLNLTASKLIFSNTFANIKHRHALSLLVDSLFKQKKLQNSN